MRALLFTDTISSQTVHWYAIIRRFLGHLTGEESDNACWHKMAQEANLRGRSLAKLSFQFGDRIVSKGLRSMLTSSVALDSFLWSKTIHTLQILLPLTVLYGLKQYIPSRFCCPWQFLMAYNNMYPPDSVVLDSFSLPTTIHTLQILLPLTVSHGLQQYIHSRFCYPWQFSMV
jgi:hypothetical protein